jgi:hypothetical protein
MAAVSHSFKEAEMEHCHLCLLGGLVIAPLIEHLFPRY